MDSENFEVKYAIIGSFMMINFMHTLNMWMMRMKKEKQTKNKYFSFNEFIKRFTDLSIYSNIFPTFSVSGNPLITLNVFLFIDHFSNDWNHVFVYGNVGFSKRYFSILTCDSFVSQIN